MKKEIRRQDKVMPKEEILDLLKTAEYGVLSTISTDNTPYGVPLNFIYQEDEGDGVFYFHSAVEGHKLENILNNSAVCFNVVDSVEVMPLAFNTKFRSATAFGTAEIIDDKAEKLEAIKAIGLKIEPDHPQEGMDYINRVFDKFKIIKMKVDYLTGKAHK